MRDPAERLSGAPSPLCVGELLRGPRTPVEETLTGIWAEVFGAEQVGVHDNLFELGAWLDALEERVGGP